MSGRDKGKEQILVIRLGALGDFMESFQSFAAIRAYHQGAHITLLTTPPFVELARICPWFDGVVIDKRAPLLAVRENYRLYRKLADIGPFARVYDLQTSQRSALYSHFIKTDFWSGHVTGSRCAKVNPWRDVMHTRPRQYEQLRAAGVPSKKDIDVRWFEDRGFELPPRPYIVLVPGASAHRPYKCWPAQHYGELAKKISKAGYLPVVIGGENEAPIAQIIASQTPICDLTNKTSLSQLATLFRHAAFVVGNDTGPMHLASVIGQRCIVLFSKYSVPSRQAPLGYEAKQIEIFWVDDLQALAPNIVADFLLDNIARSVAGRHCSS